MISLFEEEITSFNLQRASLYELKSFMRSVQNKAALNHINSRFDSLAVTIIVMIISAEKTHTLKSSQNRAAQTNSAASLTLEASEKQPPPSPAHQFRKPTPKTNC